MSLLITLATVVLSDTKLEYECPAPMLFSGSVKILAETEQFDWGWYPPTPGAMGGTQLMGFRGYCSLKAGIGSDEVWSFKLPITTLDADIQPITPQMVRQGSDEDNNNLTFFSLEQFGEIPKQLSYFTPSLETDFDLSQATFFALEQYTGVDIQATFFVPNYEAEQFGFNTPVIQVISGRGDGMGQFSPLRLIVDDIDSLSFNFPVVGTGGTQLMGFRGFNALRAGMGSDIDNWALKPPTIVTVEIGADDSPEHYKSSIQTVDDVDIFGLDQFVPLDIDVSPISPLWIQQGSDEDVSNATFFALEQYADVEMVHVNQNLFSLYETEQFNFDPPQLSSEDSLDLYTWTRTIAEDTEQVSFSPIIIQVVEIGVDASLDQITQQMGPAIGDDSEKFNWGYAFNISGTGGTQLMGFRGFNSLKGAIGSEEVWSFNLGAVVKVGIDDTLGQVSEKPRFIVDDVEMFGFNPPVVQVVEIGVDASIDQLPLQYVILDETEEFNWGFNLLVMGGGGQDISGFKGFWSLRAGMGSEVDNWGFELPIATQDSEYVFTPPVFQTSEDDYFSFQPPVVKVNEDDVAYNSIPQALSFYFTKLETEQFDWGFRQPPPTVSEDDNPYDSSPRLISFIPEIEDEMFNWGFKPPTIATSQDDTPYNYPPQQVTLYFSKLEAEQFDWGFNPPVIKITADSDELPVMGRISFDHEFDWSFNPPFSFDQDELPVISKVLFDHEVDWGFNPPIVAAKSGFDQDDLPNQTQVIFGYEVDWGFQPVGLGGTGHDMAGFRGYRSLKGAMGSEDQWSFSTPVIVVHTISFDQNEMPVVRKMHHHVDEGLDIGLGDLLIIIPLAVFATGAVLSSIDSGQVTSGIIVAGKVTFVKGS